VIFDFNLSTMYTMMHFMKTEGGYNLNEIYDMYPFEFEIFHLMCIKDVKDRIEAKRNAAKG